MKKLLICLIVAIMLLSGCEANKQKSNETPDSSSKASKQYEKKEDVSYETLTKEKNKIIEEEIES